jgi:hypothetical protein
MNRRIWPLAGAASVLLGLWILAGCDGDSDLLAPYAGQRPLTLLRVTQSETPDVQWVGGRVAVVGVNRGSAAALDSTLVWMITASDNSISSHVTIDDRVDEDEVRRYGGTPVTRLEDGVQYTVWLGERSALDAGLSPSARTEFTFADTTVTPRLLLAGRVRGGLPLQITVTRDQTLLDEQYVIDWTPSTVPVRRIAIRKGAASPSFTNLVWHVVQPDGEPDGILPPVTIGLLPPGTEEATAWPDDGFVPDTYTLWMVNSSWTGSFGLSPPGMAYFVIFGTNF